MVPSIYGTAKDRFDIGQFAADVTSTYNLPSNSFASVETCNEMVNMEADVSLDSPEASGLTGKRFENFKEQAKHLGDSEEEAYQYLREKGLEKYLMQLRGIKDPEDPRIVAGMQAGAMTLMAGTNPRQYMQHFYQMNSDNLSKNVHLGAPSLMPAYNPLDSNEINLESFDKMDQRDYVGISVVANAVVASTNAAAELFFPTKVLPASQNGAFIDISNPVVYNKTARNTSGAAYTLEKYSAVRAMVDYTILNNNANKVLPIATDDKADYLVSTDVIANETVAIAGVDQPIRPILYGNSVDLITISASETLLANRSMDEEDTLDPIVGFGTQYFQIVETIDSTETTAVFKADLHGMAGSLLQPTLDGDKRDLLGNFSGLVWIRSTDVDITDTALSETFTDVATNLSVDGAFRLGFRIKVSGSAQLTNGNMRVDAISITLESAWDEETDAAVSDDDVAVAAAAMTLTLEGWIPDARRSNTNMSIVGDIVDISDVYRICIPATMRSPFTLIKPTSVPGNGLTMQAVQMISGIRASNEAVTRMIDAYDTIAGSDGILNGSFMAGMRASIIPTAIEQALDASASVSQQRTDLAMESIQGWLSACVTMFALRLLQESDYLASLEAFTGSQQNYKFIIMTDPRIYALLMVNGENRTLGLGQKFEVAPSVDDRLKDNIWISVRRTDTNEINPHTFGGHTMMPSMLHQAVTTNSGSVTERSIYVPRYEFAPVCPILGHMTVSGLDTIFMEVSES